MNYSFLLKNYIEKIVIIINKRIVLFHIKNSCKHNHTIKRKTTNNIFTRMLQTIQPYDDNEKSMSKNAMEWINSREMTNLSVTNLEASKSQTARTELRGLKSYKNRTIPELPEVIIEQIIEYLDIPSISNISQTCKQTSGSLFSTLVLDDRKVWGRLVQTRFNIERLDCKRSKTYGGATWKLAYRSLMCANRIPKCRLLTGKGKTIFAKPVFQESQISCGCNDDLRNSNENFYSRSKHKNRKRTIGENLSGLSLWVSVGHTPDCNTRYTRMRDWQAQGNEIGYDRYVREDRDYNRQYQRFIELHLCIQNTKSSNGCVYVNYTEAFVQQIGSNHEEKICNVDVNKYGKYKPKILYYSGDNKINKSCGYQRGRTNRSMRYYKKTHPQNDVQSSNQSINCSKNGTMNTYPEGNKANNHSNMGKQQNEISLHPFEFVIIAVNVPCADEMIYETDFLSRSLVVHVPVKVECYKPTRRFPKSASELDDGNYNLNWTKDTQETSATASFMNEMQIWDHYMQLPGGCLALIDSSNSIIG